MVTDSPTIPFALDWSIPHGDRGSQYNVTNGEAVVKFRAPEKDAPTEAVLVPEIGEAIEAFRETETCQQFLNLLEQSILVADGLATLQRRVSEGEARQVELARQGKADDTIALGELRADRDELSRRKKLFDDALKAQRAACVSALEATRLATIDRVVADAIRERGDLLRELAKLAGPLLDRLLLLAWIIPTRKDDPTLQFTVLGDDTAKMDLTARKELLSRLTTELGE